MAKILELITEPTIMHVGNYFRIKVKVDDYFSRKRNFITENALNEIITEDGLDVVIFHLTVN